MHSEINNVRITSHFHRETLFTAKVFLYTLSVVILMPPRPELLRRCLSRNHKISWAAFTWPWYKWWYLFQLSILRFSVSWRWFSLGWVMLWTLRRCLPGLYCAFLWLRWCFTLRRCFYMDIISFYIEIIFFFTLRWLFYIEMTFLCDDVYLALYCAGDVQETPLSHIDRTTTSNLCNWVWKFDWDYYFSD